MVRNNLYFQDMSTINSKSNPQKIIFSTPGHTVPWSQGRWALVLWLNIRGFHPWSPFVVHFCGSIRGFHLWSPFVTTITWLPFMGSICGLHLWSPFVVTSYCQTLLSESLSYKKVTCLVHVMVAADRYLFASNQMYVYTTRIYISL